MTELTNVKVKISKEKVLKRLRTRIKVDKKIKDIIDKEIKETYSLIKPYCVYKELDIKYVKDDKVKLNDNFIIKSKNLGRILKKAEKGILIGVTIGDKIKEKTKDSTTDIIRDCIGTEAVEELAIQLNKIITNKAKLAGYKTLFRFAVGYGGWDIKDQRKIFNVLKPKKIKLLKNYRMIPIKSITAFIGWQRIK